MYGSKNDFSSTLSDHSSVTLPKPGILHSKNEMVIERRSLLINTEYILYIQMVWLNVENIFNNSENKLEFDMSLCAELDKASNTNNSENKLEFDMSLCAELDKASNTNDHKCMFYF